jgi:hypothetical protein
MENENELEMENLLNSQKDIDFENIYECLNSIYTFKINNILYTMNGQVRGFEGVVWEKDVKGKSSNMIWDNNGVAMAQDHGYDLVIRKKVNDGK